MGLLSWLNDLFRSRDEYGTPSVTLTGQPVRSKAERVIADYFTRHGIPYYYEAMATTHDWFIFKSKISKPDFYLPQYNLFVEYWGLVDSPDARTRDNYIRTMRWKMAQYRNNNIRFISIYHSNLNDLGYYFKRKFREVMSSISLSTKRSQHVQPVHVQILDMPLHINGTHKRCGNRATIARFLPY